MSYRQKDRQNGAKLHRILNDILYCRLFTLFFTHDVKRQGFCAPRTLQT